MKLMKLKYVTLLILLVAVSCKKGNDDGPTRTLQDLAFEKLEGDWTVGVGGSIEVDGQDVTANFPGFTISFNDGGYITSNVDVLFSASGTWLWENEEAGAINLDDGKLITIVTLTESTFQFQFDFTEEGGVANGVESITGNYVISVNK